jgi:ribosomal-protein-alanine N-acetyltransferase
MSADTLLLRPAAADDLDVLHGIERASFSDPWSRGAFAQALAAPEVRILVATAATEPVVGDGRAPVLGYLVLRVAADEAEILNVAVTPAARGTGVGRALVRHGLHVAAEAGALATFLEVRPSNAPALALYASFGFVTVGQRRRYYRTPVEDALVLRRGPMVRPMQP